MGIDYLPSSNYLYGLIYKSMTYLISSNYCVRFRALDHFMGGYGSMSPGLCTGVGGWRMGYAGWRDGHGL